MTIFGNTTVDVPGCVGGSASEFVANTGAGIGFCGTIGTTTIGTTTFGRTEVVTKVVSGTVGSTAIGTVIFGNRATRSVGVGASADSAGTTKVGITGIGSTAGGKTATGTIFGSRTGLNDAACAIAVGTGTAATGSKRTADGVDGNVGENGGKTGAGGDKGTGNFGGSHVEAVSTGFDRLTITGDGGVRSCIRVRTFSTVGVGDRRSAVRGECVLVFPFAVDGNCVVEGNRCALVNAAVDVFFGQPFSLAGTGRGVGYLVRSRSGGVGKRFKGGKAWPKFGSVGGATGAGTGGRERLAVRLIARKILAGIL